MKSVCHLKRYHFISHISYVVRKYVSSKFIIMIYELEEKKHYILV